MQLANTSPFSIGRARTATARLLAVGLVAAALLVAAFGLGSSPGGAIHGGAGRGDVVAPKPHVTPQTFVFTKHYDTSSPVLASVRVVIKFPDIDGECVCEPRREPIEILSW